MREMKFRAWDKKKKKMCPVWHISWKTWDDNSINYVTVEDDGTYDLLENEVELMQFTGLYDRRGKEIWEGDIVLVLNYLNGQIWEGHTHYDEVVFIRGWFDLKNPWCHESLAYNAVEVVGNKWENPEGFKGGLNETSG